MQTFLQMGSSFWLSSLRHQISLSRTSARTQHDLSSFNHDGRATSDDVDDGCRCCCDCCGDDGGGGRCCFVGLRRRRCGDVDALFMLLLLTLLLLRLRGIGLLVKPDDVDGSSESAKR